MLDLRIHFGQCRHHIVVGLLLFGTQLLLLRDRDRGRGTVLFDCVLKLLRVVFGWRWRRHSVSIIILRKQKEHNQKKGHIFDYFKWCSLDGMGGMDDIIISNQINMHKQNYQQFRDEQEIEMANYHPSIPVGQPVNPNPYPQVSLQQPQPYIPQQYPPFHPQAPVPQLPPHAFPPPPPFQMPLNLPLTGQNFSFPVQVSCPCCKTSVPTVVNQQSGNTTYLWCAFIGCCVTPLCCCVPFLMDSCLDKTHYCPNCGHVVLRKHQRCFEFVGC